MREMTEETAAAEIRKIYRYTAPQRPTEWMAMATVTDHADLTPDEIRNGIRWLNRNDRTFFGTEETNQKALGQKGQAARVRLGGSYVDVVRWG